MLNMFDIIVHIGMLAAIFLGIPFCILMMAKEHQDKNARAEREDDRLRIRHLSRRRPRRP